MIAVALSMFIILAVTGLVVSSKTTQATQTETAAMQDTARYAFDNLARSIRQAGYSNSSDALTAATLAAMSANVIGLDASSLSAQSTDIQFPVAGSIDHSDILALRFFGSGTPADDSILNCAGFGIAAASSANSADRERGWSIYYVAKNSDGESELFCKYLGKKSFNAHAIASGVDSFQVLYGVDTSQPPDGIDDQFLNATQLHALDAALPDYARAEHSYWKKIHSIKIALLLRAHSQSRIDDQLLTYPVFGAGYSDTDLGTTIREAELPASQQKRLRSLFIRTIALHNPEH